MKRKKIAILPRLYNAGGDIAKQWFVFYSYRNPMDGVMKRFRLSVIGKNREMRLTHANALIAEYTEKIKRGWTPYEDEQVIYDDMIQYSNVSKMYGDKRKSNLCLKVYIS